MKNLNCRQYHGGKMIAFNCYTGEHRETSIKPKGADWNEPTFVSFEDLEMILGV